MASDTYILVHISLWQWGIQHPIFHMEWICHHISRPITFHIFSHSPRVIRMVSEQPRWKVQELDERNIERKGHLFFNGKKTWKIFDCLKQSNTWGVIRLHTIIPYHICISLDSWCYTLNVAGQITIYHHITVGLPASSWLNHHVFWLNHVKSTFFIIFLG